MRTNAHVINERVDSYTSKRGEDTQQVISLLGVDPEHAFLNTFDYTLYEEEAAKHSGKLSGKRIELAVTNFEPAFGGRLRARGSIVKVL